MAKGSPFVTLGILAADIYFDRQVGRTSQILKVRGIQKFAFGTYPNQILKLLFQKY
jgi:hypothetical protein